MQIYDVIYVFSSEFYEESKKSKINTKGSHCSAVTKYGPPMPIFGKSTYFAISQVSNEIEKQLIPCWKAKTREDIRKCF